MMKIAELLEFGYYLQIGWLLPYKSLATSEFEYDRVGKAFTSKARAVRLN